MAYHRVTRSTKAADTAPARRADPDFGGNWSAWCADQWQGLNEPAWERTRIDDVVVLEPPEDLVVLGCE